MTFIINKAIAKLDKVLFLKRSTFIYLNKYKDRYIILEAWNEVAKRMKRKNKYFLLLFSNKKLYEYNIIEHAQIWRAILKEAR